MKKYIYYTSSKWLESEEVAEIEDEVSEESNDFRRVRQLLRLNHV